MRYIDKSQNIDDGNLITENYLNECRIQDPDNGDISYMVDYDGTFRSLPTKANSYYKQMQRLLIQNQQGICCYCMRRLQGEHINIETNKVESDTTLEHIVPQGIDEATLEYYDNEQLKTVGDNGDNKDIISTAVFNHTINPQYPPYPHTVSYRNLVASCKGLFPARGQSSCCCNNVRSNKDNAFPVYYLQKPELYIEYTIDGGIGVLDTDLSNKVDKMIVSVRLRTQSLIDIRQMWYLLRNIDWETLKTCNDDEEKRNEILCTVLYTPQIERKRKEVLLRKFNITNEWHTLMLYDIFYTIMRQQHP